MRDAASAGEADGGADSSVRPVTRGASSTALGEDAVASAASCWAREGQEGDRGDDRWGAAVGVDDVQLVLSEHLVVGGEGETPTGCGDKHRGRQRQLRAGDKPSGGDGDDDRPSGGFEDDRERGRRVSDVSRFGLLGGSVCDGVLVVVAKSGEQVRKVVVVKGVVGSLTLTSPAAAPTATCTPATPDPALHEEVLAQLRYWATGRLARDVRITLALRAAPAHRRSRRPSRPAGSPCSTPTPRPSSWRSTATGTTSL